MFLFKYMKSNNLSIKYTTVFILILFYALWKTGLHGDDYIEIHDTRNILDLKDFFLSGGRYIYEPFNYFFLFWPYPLLGLEKIFIYDIIKILCHLASVFLIYKFALNYFSFDRAFLAAVLFVFYPTHDSTIYWYMVTPYTLIPSLIMFCHHLIRKDNFLLSYPLLIISSFSYIAPPFVIGLSIIFLMEKSYKKFVAFLFPVIVYLIYYLIISKYSESYEILGNERRIDDHLSVIKFFKAIFFQIGSGIDVFFGPSFLIKIFSTYSSLSLISFLIMIPTALLINKVLKSKKPKVNFKFFFSLIIIFLVGCLMLAITDKYTQIVFNLGNRVTTYGSLFLAFFISSFSFSKKFILCIIIVFLIPFFSISDHWKYWNSEQKIIINNISNNESLKKIDQNDIIIIKGNAYSRLGIFSHIEFFIMPWNIKAIFNDKVRTKNIYTLSDYVYIKENYLIDSKWGTKLDLNKRIYLYDSKEDVVSKVDKKELEMLIKSKKKEMRHWLQILNNKKIRSYLIYFSPRLEYLFN